jgi:hypothetical protein
MKAKIGSALLVIGLASVSCKKIYTCDCVASSTNSNLSFNAYNTSKAYSKKMTKKQAKAACDHEELALKSSIESLIENSAVPQDPDDLVSVACTLK